MAKIEDCDKDCDGDCDGDCDVDWSQGRRSFTPKTEACTVFLSELDISSLKQIFIVIMFCPWHGLALGY